MQVTVKKIWKNATKQGGSPYLDRNQRPQTRVVIQTQEHGATKLSCFAYEGDPVLSLREGQTADIETQTQGAFTNFRLSRSAAASAPAASAAPNSIEVRLAQLEETAKFLGDTIEEHEGRIGLLEGLKGDNTPF